MAEKVTIPTGFYNAEEERRRDWSSSRDESAERALQQFVDANGGYSSETACKLLRAGGLALFVQGHAFEKFPINKQVFETYVKAKAVNTGHLPSVLEKKRRRLHLSMDGSIGHSAESHMLAAIGVDKEVASTIMEYGQWEILEGYLAEIAEREKMDRGLGANPMPQRILDVSDFKVLIENLDGPLLEQLNASKLIALLDEPLDPEALTLLFTRDDISKQDGLGGGTFRLTQALVEGKLKHALNRASVQGIEPLFVRTVSPKKIVENHPDFAHDVILTALMQDASCCAHYYPELGELSYKGNAGKKTRQKLIDKIVRGILTKKNRANDAYLPLCRAIATYLECSHPVVSFVETAGFSKDVPPHVAFYIAETYFQEPERRKSEGSKEIAARAAGKGEKGLLQLAVLIHETRDELLKQMDAENFDPSPLLEQKFKLAILDDMLRVGDEGFGKPVRTVIEQFIKSTRTPLDAKAYQPSLIEVPKVIRGIRERQDSTERDAQKEYKELLQQMYTHGGSNARIDTHYKRGARIDQAVAYLEKKLKTTEDKRGQGSLLDRYTDRLRLIQKSFFDESDKNILKGMLFGDKSTADEIVRVFVEMYEQKTGSSVLREFGAIVAPLSPSRARTLRNIAAHAIGQETLLKYFEDKYAGKFENKKFKNTFEGRLIHDWVRYNLGCGALNEYLKKESAQKTEQRVSLSLEPTRGFIADNYAAISDACWSPADYSLTAKYPNVTIVKHVKNADNSFRRIAGAHVLCETKRRSNMREYTNADPSTLHPDTLVVVGINPLENLSRDIDAREFVLGVLQHAWSCAKRKGLGDVLVCVDGFQEAATNRDPIWGALTDLEADYELPITRLATIKELPPHLRHDMNGSKIAEKCVSIRPLVEEGLIQDK